MSKKETYLITFSRYTIQSTERDKRIPSMNFLHVLRPVKWVTEYRGCWPVSSHY